jgi:predicted HD phosphohydrolase
MRDGTADDFRLIEANDEITARELPDRILEHLRLLDEDDGAYQISRLAHVLQTATRAERDGADADWVVGALLHDVGDVLAPHTHGEVAAEILRPFVRSEVVWVVRHHGISQRYYNASLPEDRRFARERLRDHEHYQAAVDFCERWDQCSFDPGYDTEPLEHFEPALRQVLGRVPFSSSG